MGGWGDKEGEREGEADGKKMGDRKKEESMFIS